MMFWILVGVMSLLAIAFVLLPVIKQGVAGKPWLMVGIAIALPVAAILLYQKLGTPIAATQAMQGQMPPGHSANAMMNMDLGQLADTLAAKLKTQPDDAEGWALLARTYAEIKRNKEAVQAFEKAVALLPKDPGLLADYADALATSQNGQFDQKSEELVDHALMLDPQHPKALMLKATIEFNAKHYPIAITYWQKLLKVPGLDTETTQSLRTSIEEAQHLIHTTINK